MTAPAQPSLDTVNAAPRSWGSRHAWTAGIDTTLLVAYILLQEPGGATGFKWHEWVGIAFIPLFVVHLVLSWRWIVTTWGRALADATPRARINFLLNAALFVMMMVILVSGLVVSAYAFPALGFGIHGSQRWEQLHNFTSSLVVPVVALHLALNWQWITRAFRRYVTRAGRSLEPDAEDVT